MTDEQAAEVRAMALIDSDASGVVSSPSVAAPQKVGDNVIRRRLDLNDDRERAMVAARAAAKAKAEGKDPERARRGMEALIKAGIIR